MKSSITRAERPSEFISDRLLKVTLELRGRAKPVTIMRGQTDIARTLCVTTVIYLYMCTRLISCCAPSHEAPLCSTSPPPCTRQEFPPFFTSSTLLLSLPLFFLCIWSRDEGSAVPPHPSSVPGANLVLTHGLLFFLSLSAK